MKDATTIWKCVGCGAEYTEYVNGCPKCYEGRIQQGLPPLHFSVEPVVRFDAQGGGK